MSLIDDKKLCKALGAELKRDFNSRMFTRSYLVSIIDTIRLKDFYDGTIFLIVSNINVNI